MTISITCKRCRAVLTAETEDDLAAVGQRHAQEHGHDRPLSRERILARIRRHNPEPKPEADA